MARPRANTPPRAEEGYAGRRDRRERVEPPLDQPDHDEREERQQDEDRERRRAQRHELDAQDVHDREHHDDRPGDEVADEVAEVQPVLQVLDGEHDVDGRVHEDGQRPPPGRLEAPEVAQAAARPDVEAALARDGGAELAGDERHRQRPEDGQQDQEQQREPRTRRRDHVLDAERAARHEDVDHEEDGDDTDLRPLEAADGRARGRLRCSCAPPRALVLANGRGPSAERRVRDLASSMGGQAGRRHGRFLGKVGGAGWTNLGTGAE